MERQAALRLLLDTHVLLWALANSSRLSRKASKLIGQADAELLLSPVTAYEICAKHTLGRLPEAAKLAADFEAELAPLDIEWLPISPAHAVVAGKLSMVHRDPFDRLLAVQALVERVSIVSKDEAFDGFGVERLW